VAVVRDQHSSRVKLLRGSSVVRSSPAAEDDGRLVVEVVADGVVVLREVPGEVVMGHLG
jgi:hypothetical protein